MKKTVITVIVTFVLTTLFWFAIGYLTNANTTNDYSQDIIGRWEPIEVSEHYIEFTKYGTLIQWIWGGDKERISIYHKKRHCFHKTGYRH